MNVMDKLTDVFRETFDDASIEIERTTTADDIEGWDSVSHVHLILAVERAFDLRFRAAEIGGLENVGDLADLVEQHLAKAT